MTQPLPTDLPIPDDVRAARLRAETHAAHVQARDARLARDRDAVRVDIQSVVQEARAAVEARDAEIAQRLAAAMPPDEREAHKAKRRAVWEASRALERAARNPDAMAGHLLELVEGVRSALLP